MPGLSGFDILFAMTMGVGMLFLYLTYQDKNR